MCGICGIYNFDTQQKVDSKLLKRMCDVVKHRGPDDEGIYTNDNIGLGHRRLSIIDLAQGHQPMCNEYKNIWIVFNGEIYNYPELRKELINKGHTFITNSDTEVIIHLYEEKGDEFVCHLRGMFGIALWDAKEKKLILTRDRLGKKPLHYLIEKDRIIFGSEIKSILQDDRVKRELNYEAIDDFFTFLCIPAPKTIFKGIAKLLPGHILICKPPRVFIREYWDFNFDGTTYNYKLKEDEYVERLTELLNDTVRCRLMSEVPLGAFLSGGIDSSSIVAIMSQFSERPVVTSSIGFEEDAFNELAFAKVIAEHFKTDHHEYVVSPNIRDILPKLIYYFDEPFADPSAIPTYYVSKLSKEEVTVALSGDGGDEVFAGYNLYFSDVSQDKVRRYIPQFIKRYVLLPLLNHYPKFLRAKRYLNSITHSFEKAFVESRGHNSHQIKERLYSDGLKSKLKGYDSFVVLEPYLKKSECWDTLSRAQYVDVKTYLPNDILVKVDKMSMGVSLEVRAPLLDHNLIEFVATIPPNLRIKGKTSKYILKKTMKNILPSQILNRKKKGFSVPIGSWLKKELKDIVDEILFEPKTSARDYFNTKYIQQMWSEHQKGRRDFAYQIWPILMLELWERVFIEKESIIL